LYDSLGSIRLLVDSYQESIFCSTTGKANSQRQKANSRVYSQSNKKGSWRNLVEMLLAFSFWLLALGF